MDDDAEEEEEPKAWTDVEPLGGRLGDPPCCCDRRSSGNTTNRLPKCLPGIRRGRDNAGCLADHRITRVIWTSRRLCFGVLRYLTTITGVVSVTSTFRTHSASEAASHVGVTTLLLIGYGLMKRR